MTAAHAAATSYVPAARAALAAATARGCNGEQLVVVRTDEGRDVQSCPGCADCRPVVTTAPAPVRSAARRASDLADVFASCNADDLDDWF